MKSQVYKLLCKVLREFPSGKIFALSEVFKSVTRILIIHTNRFLRFYAQGYLQPMSSIIRGIDKSVACFKWYH